jgi:hypothetical protein
MAKCRIGGYGRWVLEHQLVCDQCYERHLREEVGRFEQQE